MRKGLEGVTGLAGVLPLLAIFTNAPQLGAAEAPAVTDRAERPIEKPEPTAPVRRTPPPSAAARDAATAWLADLHASNLCVIALANAGRERGVHDEARQLFAQVRTQRLALDRAAMAALQDLDVPQATAAERAAPQVTACLGDPERQRLFQKSSAENERKLLATLAATETNDLDRLRSATPALAGVSSVQLREVLRQAEDNFREGRAETERLLRQLSTPEGRADRRPS